MEHYTVAVIGGGATGTGILRDLALRGINAVLFEQGSLAHGTSARFHGLLHSGARYAVKDFEAAKECFDENMILRRIAKPCVEETEGYFVLAQEDDDSYVNRWQEACSKAQIPVAEKSIKEALLKEPNLTPKAKRIFTVPDSCIDGFRLLWHNAIAAKKHGAQAFTYHRVLKIHQKAGHVCGLSVLDRKRKKIREISCDYVISASGAWSGEVAGLAGLEVKMSPDKGTLVVFNHRFTSRVINRLRPSGDGDIFVPHGSVTILGTTSSEVDSPDKNKPTTAEVLRLLELGKPLFPELDSYRILRAFAGNRPLYAGSGKGRQASRNFHVVDHAGEGMSGFISIFGGKLTTYRLMAEKVVDLLCEKMGVKARCRTAEEFLVPALSPKDMKIAGRYFSSVGTQIVADRAGFAFPELVADLELPSFAGKELICECEMVSKAEIAMVAKESTTYSLHDIRLRTRFGMGTCQGTFCSLRVMGLLAELKIPFAKTPCANLREFLQERWQGVRPVLWGTQLKEAELTRAVYAASLNLDGEIVEQHNIPETGSLGSFAKAVEPIEQIDFDEVLNETKAQPADTQMLSGTISNKKLQIPTCLGGVRKSDVVVIGAGLAGLLAALVASLQGKKVTLLSKGAGTVAISGGNVDLLGYVQGQRVLDPWQGMDLLADNHPYKIIGKEKVRSAMSFFQSLCKATDYGLVDNAGKNLFVPTVLGTFKPTYFCGTSANPLFLEKANTCLLVGIEGVKDCGLSLLGAAFKEQVIFSGKTLGTLSVPRPFAATHRAINALDVARFLNTAKGQAWFVGQLPTSLKQTDLLITPPICGTNPNQGVWQNLHRALGVPILEMSTVPPGVGGLRLKEMLEAALAQNKVEIVENTLVTGARTVKDKCIKVVSSNPDGERCYQADSFVLATGGILGGGLELLPTFVKEAVFALDVACPAEVVDRSSPNIFGKHHFASMGIAVDKDLNPVDKAGSKLLSNVYVAGRSLGGYDFATEKSGHGVAIATGWLAGLLAGENNAQI